MVLLISPKLQKFYLLIDEPNAERLQRTIQDTKSQSFAVSVVGNELIFDGHAEADMAYRMIRALGFVPVVSQNRVKLLHMPAPMRFEPSSFTE